MNPSPETEPVTNDEAKKDEKPSINVLPNVPSGYNPDYGKWAAAVELHRRINDTTGEESEE